MSNCHNIFNVNFQDITKISGLLNNKGELLTHNGTNLVRLPVGVDGRFLVADSAQPEGMAWDTLGGDSITIAGGAAGDVVYIDASGNLVVDTGNFSYNPTGGDLEFNAWVSDAYAAGTNQGVVLGSISNQVATGDSIALGAGSSVSGIFGVALGHDTTVAGNGGVAIGDGASAPGENSVALGPGAIASCPNMFNFSGPISIRKTEAAATGTERLQKFSGGLSVVSTETIAGSATAASYQIDLPAGCVFYPQVIKVVTSVAGAGSGASPFRFSFGENGDTTKYTPLITNYNKGHLLNDFCSYYGFDSSSGTTTPLVNITVPDADVGSVRFVWEGVIVEND